MVIAILRMLKRESVPSHAYECPKCGLRIENLPPSAQGKPIAHNCVKTKNLFSLASAALTDIKERLKTDVDKRAAPLDVIESRLRHCQVCPRFKVLPLVGGMCSECGCRMSSKESRFNALAWATKECPLGKWGKYDPD